MIPADRRKAILGLGIAISSKALFPPAGGEMQSAGLRCLESTACIRPPAQLKASVQLEHVRR